MTKKPKRNWKTRDISGELFGFDWDYYDSKVTLFELRDNVDKAIERYGGHSIVKLGIDFGYYRGDEQPEIEVKY